MNKSIVAFCIINAAFILANIVAAGLLMVGNTIIGGSENIILWLAVEVITIGGALIFLRGAFDTLRDLVTKWGG